MKGSRIISGGQERKNWRQIPQIARNVYLVLLERKFCLDYDEKKFTAVAMSEQVVILIKLK